MPTTNERKHVIPAGGDASFSRATIFEAFGNSIHDVIPVANATERAQVVSDLAAKGAGPTATDPLVVIRGDAPGLHRVEYTYDGSVWLPASGVLSFASKAAADSWGAANGGLLSVNDECRVAGASYFWSGTDWNRDTDWTPLTLTSGWVNYGAPFRPAAVRVHDGQIQYQGVIKSGSVGTPNPITTVAAPFRPTGGDGMFSAIANAGAADVRVQTDGTVIIAAFKNGGDNAIVSLHQIQMTR